MASKSPAAKISLSFWVLNGKTISTCSEDIISLTTKINYIEITKRRIIDFKTPVNAFGYCKYTGPFI